MIVTGCFWIVTALTWASTPAFQLLAVVVGAGLLVEVGAEFVPADRRLVAAVVRGVGLLCLLLGLGLGLVALPTLITRIYHG